MRQTGNYYYGARYYNPKWSTWLSVDPLREETLDSYGYCYQNPINLVDPTGMSADWYLNDDNNNYEYFEGSIERQGYTSIGPSTNLVIGGRDNYSLNEDGSFQNTDTGKSYKKGDNLVVQKSIGTEIVSNLNMKEKSSRFASDLVAPFIELPQIIFPMINQANIVINEGTHEGRAYDYDNVLIKNTYKFENWRFEKDKSTQSTGLSFEDGQEIINNTISVVFKTKAIKIVKNKVVNTILKATIGKSIKSGLKQLEDK